MRKEKCYCVNLSGFHPKSQLRNVSMTEYFLGEKINRWGLRKSLSTAGDHVWFASGKERRAGKQQCTWQSLASQRQGRNLWLPRQTGSGWAHTGCWWCQPWDGLSGTDSERNTSHCKKKNENKITKLGRKIPEFLNTTDENVRYKISLQGEDLMLEKQRVFHSWAAALSR